MKTEFATETCSYCEYAETDQFCGLYRSTCRGCNVRALAQSPAFFESEQAGKQMPAYMGSLRATFGDGAVAQAHTDIKQEAKRIKALRAQKGMA